jgi:signal transduction histidine kinase
MDLAERKSFLEQEIRRVFDFQRVEILERPAGPERFSSESTRVRDLLTRVMGIIDGTRQPFLSHAIAKELGVAAILGPLRGTYAFPMRHGGSKLGLLVIDSSPQMELNKVIVDSLQSLTNQVAIVLENSSLLDKKIELERKLAKQAQMVQLGEMTARIAHEIKNPLSSIKTIVQLMLEDPALCTTYGRDLDLINGELDRLRDSAAQLLTFARPAPEMQTQVKLRDEAESALNFLARDFQSSGVQAVNEIPENLPPVMGNSSVFREIFLNLMINALQAGSAGMHLWLRAGEGMLEDGSERFILLTVEDDGPGIRAEALAKVFDPFYTTKQKGTGLGLTIVRRNIEHLGGHVTVESPARGGIGTRFVIHLPPAQGEQSAIAQSTGELRQ